MKPRTLALTPEQRAQREDIRDHDRRPYFRERAAALLKVSEGLSAHWVARYGLLKPRDPAPLYGWLDVYETEQPIRPRPSTRRSFSP
jgi:hypothetical protein